MLAVLAANRRRIVEVGTAIGYSTLWMALALPADGTVVTIDPDRDRTDRARAFWRRAGLPEARISVVNAPALEAFAGPAPELQGPFDMVFIDALKDEYLAYLAALMDRLAPGAVVVADNVLWSGRTSGRERPDRATAAMRCASSVPASPPTRPSRRRSCRSAMGCSWPRCGRDGNGRARPRPAVRDAARDCRNPAARARPRRRRDDRGRVAGVGREAPAPCAGSAVRPVRQECCLRAGNRARRRRRGRDDPAGQRRCRRCDRGSRPILEIRESPFTKSIVLATLSSRLATPDDGAVVGFLGITRSSPGTPAPGQEDAAARHAGRAVSSLEYEAHPAMTLRVMADDRVRDRPALRRRAARDRPSDRRGPARRAVGGDRRVCAAPGRRLRCRALRDRRDEGPSSDLEGRALQRRQCLDRRAGGGLSEDRGDAPRAIGPRTWRAGSGRTIGIAMAP